MSYADRTEKIENWRVIAMFILFAVSGAAGLVYEVVWVRQLTTVLGASTFAVSIVLVSFMTGLGLGAWLLGKVADRLKEASLVKAYVGLEVGIGCYAIAFPRILQWAEKGYVHFYQNFNPGLFEFQVFKLSLALILLVIPTTLMGATLPILSRYLIRKKGTASLRLSGLYAANTFGAIVGTVAAGYFLLPAFGVWISTVIAVFLNILAAVGFLLFHLLSRNSKKIGLSLVLSNENPDTSMTPSQWGIAIGFGLSGLAAMFYQVAWTRTLSMILGTTTFAFTTMLATFLAGITLGSCTYGLWRKFSNLKLYICFQLIAAFSAFLTIPLFEKLPVLYLSLQDNWGTSWLDMQMLRFVLAALIMFIPTFALGTMFPIVTNLLLDHLSHVGGRVGKAYALNTLGAVIGAGISGLVLVPLVGMQQTIIFGGLVNLLAGLGVALMSQEMKFPRRLQIVAASGCLAVVVVSLIQPWSPRIMNSGVYLYGPRYQKMKKRVEAIQQNTGEAKLGSWEIWEMAMKQYDLLFYKPGLTATVAVMEREDGVRFLTVDGKTDASTGEKSDMRTQVIIGQLPMLLHKDPDKVLIVGLGSGITAGSVLTHDVRVVDVAEISSGVIQASSFFSQANHNAVEDPRLRIIPRDARNMMLTNTETYDVVISQPSNPWIKGQASLFTEEWYIMVKEHLNEEGIFVQWVPSYLMSDQDFKIIAHTLRTVFPHITLWRSGSVGDLVFLASKDHPLKIDFKDFKEKTAIEPVATDLARVGESLHEILLAQFVMGEKELISYLYSQVDQRLKINTDDHPIIEFSTPKQIVHEKSISRFVDPKKRQLNIDSLLDYINMESRGDFDSFLKSTINLWEENLYGRSI